MPVLRASQIAMLALVVMSLIWGYNWVMMKQVIQYVAPFDFAALRSLLGAASLFAVMAVLRRPMRIVPVRQVIWLGLLQTALFTGLVQWALVSGAAGKTAVLVYTMPFWLLPLAFWWLQEKVRRIQWLAAALAGAGLVLILAPWEQGGSVASSVLALGGGLAWALSAIVAKVIRRDHEVDLLAMTAWQMLFGALALGVVAGLVPSRPIEPSPYFFVALAYNAVLATAMAWLLWLYVLNHLSTGMAGLSALGIPLIGVCAGWVELGERPGGVELIGMLLIFCALALTSVWSLWQASRRPPGPLP